eukprot:m.1131898 g.1131898  ORF g.1131898 m.1131898 type:complete len:68 (+) comp24425_c0_seq8:2323-2526(+)
MWCASALGTNAGHSPFFQVLLVEETSVKHMAPALIRFFVNMEETDPYERGSKREQVNLLSRTWAQRR